MKCTISIYILSHKFYSDYPSAQYPEIAVKKGRPYSCLLLEYIDGILICIPFRSHVHHKFAYHFKHSVRSKRTKSGLDYTKTVLIKDSEYIDNTTKAVVDQDEYKEVIENLSRISQEVYEYILDYKNDLNNVKKLHPREWERRYGMSTLPYFNEFLKDRF